MNNAELYELAKRGEWDQLERTSRRWLSQKRFFLPHLFLIHCLLRSGRLAEADAEFEDLVTYKFNLQDHLSGFPSIAHRYGERLKKHYVLNTMRTHSSLSITAAEKAFVRWKVESTLTDTTEYIAAAEEIISAALPVVEPADRATSSICTFGSCFAANLARFMNQQGVKATNLLIEEAINSTYANKALLEVALGKDPAPVHNAMREEFGEALFSEVRDKLGRATHVVLTVGVAPCFFEKGTGNFVFAKNYVKLIKAGEIEMRTTTVSENLINLRAIIDLVSEISPHSVKVLTVSPVPLVATAEMRSAVIADCVSKSTLRAAVHELTTNDKSLIYFPAFEVFRWLSSHSKVEAFGADDGDSRHVSNWLVNFAVSSFIDRFFAPAA